MSLMYIISTRALTRCAIFTSTLPRAVQTASFVPSRGRQPGPTRGRTLRTARLTRGLGAPKPEPLLSRRPQTTSALNPLDKGVCYGLTEADFKRDMPREHERWRSDVRRVRYPGGESFNDLILRIEGVLIDIEQQTSPVLVVSHLSTLQVPRPAWVVVRSEA